MDWKVIAALHADNGARDVEQIVEALRMARHRRRGATQPKVARRASISAQAVCNIEGGGAVAKLDTAARLARALGYRLVAIPVAAVIDDAATLEELDAELVEQADRDAKRAAAAARAVAAGDVWPRWEAERSAAERDARKLAAGDVWPWGEAGAPVPPREG